MKKRALVLFLILSILSTLCFVSYADGNAFTVGMVSDKKAVSKGDTFTVTISVNQIYYIGILNICQSYFGRCNW